MRPSEIHFSKKGEHVSLRAIAHWSDGTSEDVTPLCRYQSNDEQVAKIDAIGLVTSVEAGDSHVVAFYDAGVAPVPSCGRFQTWSARSIPTCRRRPRSTGWSSRNFASWESSRRNSRNDSEFLRRVSLDLTGSAARRRRSRRLPGRQVTRQAPQEDRRTARAADLCRLVDDASVRPDRQQRPGPGQHHAGQSTGEPGMVRLDPQAGSRKRSVRQARRRDRVGDEPSAEPNLHRILE